MSNTRRGISFLSAFAVNTGPNPTEPTNSSSTPCYTPKVTKHKTYGHKIKNAAESIEEKLWPIEEAVIQFRAAVRRDLIALPVMLNDKLSSLAGFIETADGRPTKQDYELFADLSKRAKGPLEKFNQLVKKDLASFNHLIRELNIPAIILIKQKE